MKIFRLALMSVTVFVAACSDTLEVKKLSWDNPGVGYPYFLPYTQFDVTVKWRITACQDGTPEPIRFRVTADFKEKAKLPVDPALSYVINPTALQGLFRSTEFQVEYDDNRYVKSINSAVDDQTGDAIVSTLAGLAKLGTNVAPRKSQSLTTRCPEAFTVALAKINGLPGQPGQAAITAQAEKDVAAQTAIVNRLTAVLAATSGSARAQARRDLATAEAQLAQTLLRYNVEKETLEGLVAVVTETQTLTWPEDSKELEFQRGLKPSAGAFANLPGDSMRKLTVYWRLIPLRGPSEVAAATTQEPTATLPDSLPGLPYREPRPMTLELCDGNECNGTPSLPTTNLISSEIVRVFQGGSLMFLPFNARTFANIKNGASFKNAVLASGGTTQVRGAGTGVAQTFEKGAASVASLITELKGADLKRLQAEKAEIDARTALLTAKANLRTAEAAEQKAVLAALEADATLAKSDRIGLDVERALSDARRQRGEP